LLRKLGIILVTLLAGLSWLTASFAHSFVDFNGIYLGMQGGVNIIDYKREDIVRNPGRTNLIDIRRLTNFAFTGGVQLGAGWVFNWFYLGGEIFANLTAVSVKESAIQFDNPVIMAQRTLRLSSEFGIEAHPGIVFYTKNLLFFVGGVTWGHFRFRDQSELDVGTQTAEEYPKGLTGSIVGLGLARAISRHVVFRVIYKYIFYSTFTNTFVDGITNLPDDHYHRARSQEILFGLNFYLK